MKKNLALLIVWLILITLSIKSNSQTLVVSGSLFLPQDSISFTYTDPVFTEKDWIGIYHSDEVPGGPGASSWNYVPSPSGTLKLPAPTEAGTYKAFLLCCDAYDTIAISDEFSIEVPSLISSYPSYIQGDSMVFSYISPRFSSTDWIGIYPKGTKPGNDNPSIDWGYITSSEGTMTFKTSLNPGIYDAYLLCCGGYDSISACTFEVVGANIAVVTPVTLNFKAGATLEFIYNDPDFADGDWIALYLEDDDPTMVPSVAWSKLESKTGVVSFPGVLAGGYYIAVLFCCNNTETEYARSVSFNIAESVEGTYVKTGASVYPEETFILVNYRDKDFTSTDWIGIYRDGEIPGNTPSIVYAYTPKDSGTIAMDPLPVGDYIVYLLCCDGYNIKAKYNFKVVDSSVPSLIASSITYDLGEDLVFTYNDPAFVATDWIGIYNPGEIPGGGDAWSIVWNYVTDVKGDLSYIYPGSDWYNPQTEPLAPGEYWAGLFCCDGYELYASASFVVTEFGVGVKPGLKSLPGLNIFPNPGNGLVNISVPNNEKIQGIMVYSVTGQLVFQETNSGSVHEKVLDLKINKGIYFLEVRTDISRMIKKLILQ